MAINDPAVLCNIAVMAFIIPYVSGSNLLDQCHHGCCIIRVHKANEIQPLLNNIERLKAKAARRAAVKERGPYLQAVALAAVAIAIASIRVAARQSKLVRATADVLSSY